MAHLGLADTMDTAKALLQPVRVPRQVVVDHQVCALEIDALAGSIGGQQDLHLRVVLEGFLHLQTCFSTDAPVDDDHGFAAAQQRGNALFQIVKRVAVLGENDQLLVGRRLGRWNCAGAIGGVNFGDMVSYGTWSEDFAKQAGQFEPLGICAAAAHCQCLRLPNP